MSVTSWFLVSSGGTRHRLPREMIFVGRDDCELMLQSRSVDKQHAVINYEAGTDEHKVKDLGSLNGVSTQTEISPVDVSREMNTRQQLNPDEHEKFTSGLQLSKKLSNGETTTSTTTSKSPTKTPTKTQKSPSGGAARTGESRATVGVTSSKEPPAKPVDSHKAEERIGGDVTALPRGTPLYGQPSWWGDGDADDENSFKQDTKSSTKKHDGSISGRFYSNFKLLTATTHLITIIQTCSGEHELCGQLQNTVCFVSARLFVCMCNVRVHPKYPVFVSVRQQYVIMCVDQCIEKEWGEVNQTLEQTQASSNLSPHLGGYAGSVFTSLKRETLCSSSINSL
ncbi:putative centrosomal protein of 170 kDa, partial [Scophthalmus maximus]